jgi:hypothetical protein
LAPHKRAFEEARVARINSFHDASLEKALGREPISYRDDAGNLVVPEVASEPMDVRRLERTPERSERLDVFAEAFERATSRRHGARAEIDAAWNRVCEEEDARGRNEADAAGGLPPPR